MTTSVEQCMKSLKIALDGRKLKRIKILALDDFRNDSTKILQELAFILNVKEHLGADEMTSQEQRATEFEMEYLKLIGIVTPEADNYGQPKRGLAEG
ncbi:hypothetical protein L596_027053 [Steinernema carpocapsae]|uniref:Uncharacterized protein n=1 Tax=Steinernema carpocapsae TaxID=34508 RepID=A0A4U5M439_STECR|nr:hypothetical protein L596_027053 [Steinernema carpocapsae]